MSSFHPPPPPPLLTSTKFQTPFLSGHHHIVVCLCVALSHWDLGDVVGKECIVHPHWFSYYHHQQHYQWSRLGNNIVKSKKTWKWTYLGSKFIYLINFVTEPKYLNCSVLIKSTHLPNGDNIISPFPEDWLL